MRRPLVAGNWKMHGTHSSVAELIKGLRQLALPSGVDVAVMPPCLSGLTASPAQAQEVHAAIRAQLAAENAEVAKGVRLLYGGSVKAASAAELFGMPDIDGGLVGGASLNADEFGAICRAAGS